MYAVFGDYHWSDGRWFGELLTTPDTKEDAIAYALKEVLERDMTDGPEYGLRSMTIEDWTSSSEAVRDDGKNIVWAYDRKAGIDPTGQMAHA